MNDYEGLYIIDTKGKDDKIDDFVEPIEKEIAGCGGKVRSVHKIDRRKFERVAHHLDSGYYVTIKFAAPEPAIETLQAKLKFNEAVFRQMYVRADRLPGYSKRKLQKAAAAAAAASA